MGRVVVTIEWAVAYLVGLMIFVGFVYSSTPRASGHANWFDVAVFLAFPLGLGVIVRQGSLGRLPGTAGSGMRVFRILARLLAWSGGLALAIGAAGALAGYVALDAAGPSHTEGEGILIIIPGVVGFLFGGLAGAIVAVVKSVR